MMIVTITKKMMAAIVFSVLSIVAFWSVSYAFGFFSSTAPMDDVEVRLGRVALKFDEEAPNDGLQALEWTSYVHAHMELEQESHAILNGGEADPGAVQYAMDNNFSGWWRQYEGDLNSFFRESTWISPGGFIVKQYSFVNESTVPVYFRIAKPQISVADDPDLNLKVSMLAWATSLPEQRQDSWNYDSAEDTLLVGAGPADDYLYLERPVEPEQQYCVTFVVYVLGGANGNPFQTKRAVFSVDDAELIQAQNNAVYLDDDWKDAANNGVNFIPYTNLH